MKGFKDKITLFNPVSYEIEVQGILDKSYLEWNHVVDIRTKDIDSAVPVTTLSCTVDQAGLLGILRRLITHGLPLISISLLET